MRNIEDFVCHAFRSWVKLSSITKLGESKEYDALLQSVDVLPSKQKKQIKSLRHAYNSAIAVMETPEEVAKRQS